MANWYIAPDGLTKTGLTFANIGDPGYGTAWNKAVRWSEFQTASGAWPNRANSDVFHFLACSKPYTITNGVWVGLVNNKTGTTFQSESIDGRVMRGAVIKGTRDTPWPKAGETATYAGEVFMTITVAASAATFNSMSFVNIKSVVQPNAAGADMGHFTFNDCYAKNVSRGLFYTEARGDGRCSVEMNRCQIHGYDKGNARIWANNDGLGISTKDCFFDSEHQNDNSSFNNASTPSAMHIMDSIPTVQTVKSPMTVERVTVINHRAGYTGSSYPQGDGIIAEENVGTITLKDVLSYGNGDRGIDLKCSGTVVRHSSFGDGYALGHHLDTNPVDAYNCIYYTGARLTASGAPPSVACVQASGWTRMFKSWFSARPTATQEAFTNYAISTASVDPHKWQGQVYGGTHQGKVEMTDSYETVKTSVGAAETTGYAGSGVNGRVGAIFGLTPSTSYTVKVRGLGPDGAAGTYSSTVTQVLSADGGGERVALAAPTGFTAAQVVGAPLDLLFTWTGVAEDAGTAVQGYIVEIDFSDGNGFVPFLPGKSCSPLTLSGFQPGTSYTARVRAFDANMNLGTASSTSSATTAAGSTAANTPNAPTNVAVDSGWIDHCTALGIGSASNALGFTAPSTGAVSLYEIRDNAGTTLYARMGSIRLASQDTPTLTKTNVTVTNV